MTEVELKKNTVIGEWRLEKPLGNGGQGEVWKVRYTGDNHCPASALKFCSDSAPKARKRFSRELDLLIAQKHPGIVRVRDHGEFCNRPYFVMELASTTLADIAIAATPGTRLILASRELLLRFVREACQAVAHLHGKGIIHRDLKPSNVLLMLNPPEPMRAVIADLGIASHDLDQGKLTATQEVIGTPTFRAPESFSGQHSTQSDVYSLGKTIEAVINRGEPVTIGPGKCLRDSSLTDELWDALDRVLAQACAYDPVDRYDDASHLVKALPEAVLGLDSQSTTGTTCPQRQTVTSLSVTEKIVLSEFIARCPSNSDYELIRNVRRNTLLEDFSFSMSIHRLLEIDFFESFEVTDQNGYECQALRPTEKGFLWAQNHKDDIIAAIAEVASKKKSTDDDIPF